MFELLLDPVGLRRVSRAQWLERPGTPGEPSARGCLSGEEIPYDKYALQAKPPPEAGLPNRPACAEINQLARWVPAY